MTEKDEGRLKMTHGPVTIYNDGDDLLACLLLLLLLLPVSYGDIIVIDQ